MKWQNLLPANAMTTPNIILSKATVFNWQKKKKTHTEMVYTLRALCYLAAKQNGLCYPVNRNKVTMYFMFSLHGYI